jgi:hypothetical protein
MARPKNHAKHVSNAVADLLRSVTGLVDAVAATLSGPGGSRGARPTTRKGERLRSSLKAYWARLEGAAREERIRKMLAGRGLKPKARPRKT